MKRSKNEYGKSDMKRDRGALKSRLVRILLTALSVIMIIASLSACGGNAGGSGQDGNGSAKVKVVSTIYPEADWVREIAGDLADNTFLIDSGVDMHSFQPSAKDIQSIGSADVFIYTGGESEAWVENALKETGNKGAIVINLLDVLGDEAKEEEVKEGMQEEDHEHDADGDDHDADDKDNDADDHDADDHVEHEEELDEHVWLSLENAEIFTDEISKALAKADPANKAVYEENARNYMDKLKALDEEYREAIDEIPKKLIVCGDRFPFRYLMDDYDVDYYAAFVGCSAETEASFETIRFLSEKVEQQKLGTIIVTEGSDQKIAKAIINNTKAKGQKIVVLDSMQSKTRDDEANGVTYLSVMEKNLAALKEALAA